MVGSSVGSSRLTGVIAMLMTIAMTATACGGGSFGEATADDANTQTASAAEPNPEPTEIPAAATATPVPEPTIAPEPTPVPEPTPTPGPDFDGDGTPDDADDDDDGDGVDDTDDEFPFNPDRHALLTPQFPVVDGVVQLPEVPSVEGLRWIQDQMEADTTTAEQVQDRFAQTFLDRFGPAEVAGFINNQRDSETISAGFEPLDARVVGDYFVWVLMGDPSAPLGSPTVKVSVGADPVSGLINVFGIQDSISGPDGAILPEDAAYTIATAVEQLGTKAPNTSVLVAEINDDKCTAIAGKDETVTRGLAWAVRPWILGALATEIQAGTIARDDVITVTPGEQISTVSQVTGAFDEPADFSVQELANLMMTMSDAGAADVLHALIGRDALDSYVGASGHTNPDALTPVLSTSEFNNLYGNVGLADAQSYLTLDEEAQGQFVADVLEPLAPSTASAGGSPSLIQDLIWQASPIDVCNNMATMRGFAPESEAGMFVDEAHGEAVSLFGVRNEWDRVWYKGGAYRLSSGEPVVWVQGWMVESNDGRVYAVVAMLNSESAIPNASLASEVESLTAQILHHLAAGTGS